MTVIGELEVNAVMRTEGISRGVKTFRQEMMSAGNSVVGMTGRLLGLTSATGLAAAGYVLVSERAKKFDTVVNQADRLGIASERLQELNYAAGQTSNVRDLAGNMTALGRTTAEAANGLGKGREAISRLKLDAEDLAGRPIDQQLLRIADAMRSVDDPGDRIAIATRLGMDADMVTMLTNGSRGIQELAVEARNLGTVLDETSARSLADTNDSLDKMRSSLHGAADAAAAGLAPAIESAADAATYAINNIRGLGMHIGYWLEGTTAEAEAALNRQVAMDAQRNREMSARVRNDREIQRLAKRRDTENAIADARRESEAKAKAAAEVQERLRSRIGDVGNQIQTFGMTDTQREIFNVRSVDGDPRLKSQLILQLEQLDRLNQAQERAEKLKVRDNELTDRASALLDRNQSALQKYREELADIQELYNAGKITAADYGRAVEKTRHSFEESNSVVSSKHAPLSAIKFGTSEAARAIAESRNARNGEQKLLLKEAVEGNKIAKEMLATMKAPPEDKTPVAPWN